MEREQEQVYKEGLLWKRQRGLRASLSQLRKLKFQERWCQLTSSSLNYHSKRMALKGLYPVDRIRIVEAVSEDVFNRKFCFQIGDYGEVMYFAATTSVERNEWMEAFQRAVSDNGNEMLLHCHTGAYGLIHKGRWSCCDNPHRAAAGCCRVTSCRPQSLLEGNPQTEATWLLPLHSTLPTESMSVLSSLLEFSGSTISDESLAAEPNPHLPRTKSSGHQLQLRIQTEDPRKCVTLPRQDSHSSEQDGAHGITTLDKQQTKYSTSKDSLDTVDSGISKGGSANSSRHSSYSVRGRKFSMSSLLSVDEGVVLDTHQPESSLEATQENPEPDVPGLPMSREERSLTQSTILAEEYLYLESEDELESDQGSNEEAALHPSSRQVQPHVDQHLLSRIHTINADQEGCEYYSPTDGYSLIIPPGAIPEGESISVVCGVVPYGPLGPFEYPSGWNPVSPIVWFCPVGKIQFQRPIEIKLPHCFDCESSEECKNLDFLKADHAVPKIGEIDAEVFQFRQVDGQKYFTPDSYIGTLHTTHFCFYCIASQYSVHHTVHTNFCLITTMPLRTDRKFQLHFCLAYFLDTCIKAVKEQFSQEEYYVNVKRMKFAGEERDPTIKIKYQNYLPKGWVVTRWSSEQIHSHEVSFSDQSFSDLKLSHSEKLYPPRFTLEVSGLKAFGDAILRVDFEGAQEDLSMEICLTLPTEGPSLSPHSAVAASWPVANGTGTHPPYNPSHAALALNPGQQKLQMELTNGHYAGPPLYYNGGPHYNGLDDADSPSDAELEDVTKEVMGKLGSDWPKLQSFLGVPEYIMAQVKEEQSLGRRVMALLKAWRYHSRTASRTQLAECLRRTDSRLHRAADILLFTSSNQELISSSNTHT